MKIPVKSERRIALVIIDAQLKFFTDPDAESNENRRIHVPIIDRALRMFHAAGRPVIFVLYDGYTHDTMIKDPALEHIIPELEPGPDDLMVHKYHMNSFRNTNLADVVKSVGCDSVLLAGAYTQYCVMASYFGASDHNLSAYLLKDGTIATEEKAVMAAEMICKTFDLDDVAENLATTKVEPPGNDQCRGRDSRKLPTRCSSRPALFGAGQGFFQSDFLCFRILHVSHSKEYEETDAGQYDHTRDEPVEDLGRCQFPGVDAHGPGG